MKTCIWLSQYFSLDPNCRNQTYVCSRIKPNYFAWRAAKRLVSESEEDSSNRSVKRIRPDKENRFDELKMLHTDVNNNHLQQRQRWESEWRGSQKALLYSETRHSTAANKPHQYSLSIFFGILLIILLILLHGIAEVFTCSHHHVNI